MNLRIDHKPIYSFTNDTNTIRVYDVGFDILGLTGGLTLAICTIPQIIQILKTKSSKNLSFSWLFITLFGLLQMAAYIGYNFLFPLFFSMGIELVLYIILIILKYAYKKKK